MSTNSFEHTLSAASTPSPAAGNTLAGAHHYVTMKLTSKKFLFWRMQLLPFLRGQELTGFVDGSHPCPSEMITADSSTGSSSTTTTSAALVQNPAYHAWVKQDQTIVSLLISSMSDEVLHLALGRNTSADIWASVSSALGSTSRTRCLNLLGQFQLLRQGNSTIANYLGRAGVLVESLIQAGRPLSLMEQNLYVIRGLRPELKSLATSLTATGTPVTVADGATSHTALYAGTGRGSHGGGGRNSPNQQRGGGRGNRDGQQRGGRGGPRCQICRSHGHFAIY
ncbi:PREDICTED: uncharacterized protein LOC109153873 [Ipomoea nil]|uniref:uncharacterized protein LOC109153873 n=1 Tax=Ipomoea nil TaxID=35883 RepID=UPI000901B1DD|nr:PREDICTED: uncharacterized protein LOC109153873 [Ipomoea nil]